MKKEGNERLINFRKKIPQTTSYHENIVAKQDFFAKKTGHSVRYRIDKRHTIDFDDNQ